MMFSTEAGFTQHFMGSDLVPYLYEDGAGPPYCEQMVQHLPEVKPVCDTSFQSPIVFSITQHVPLPAKWTRC